MYKLEIIISWDGIMKQSQFVNACSDTIRHGIVSDKNAHWHGTVCSPFSEMDDISKDHGWNHSSYGESENYFGWMRALELSDADWVLLTYPGVAVHIDGLISNIENIADPNDAVCYCAAANTDVDGEICEMLRQSGVHVSKLNELITHEWGSLLISRAAARRMAQNSSIMSSLASRSGSPIRFDHISVLSRVKARVPLVPVKCMNPNRSTEIFSGTNRSSSCNLMHYVGDWMDEYGWHDYLKARLFASSMDGLKDGEFGTDLSMPEIKSDAILILAEPGNVDRIKWLQKSCQQHIRPVPSMVVMLQESKNGKYYGKDYEKTVDFCASTRTGIIRMRQDRDWNEQALLLRGCQYLINKNVKKIFACVGDCCVLNDPFKYMDKRSGLVYFNDDGNPGLSAFGVCASPDQMSLICEKFELWNDHAIMRQETQVESHFLENFKIMRRESLYWKSTTKESFFRLAKDAHIVAATGESACRTLVANS